MIEINTIGLFHCRVDSSANLQEAEPIKIIKKSEVDSFGNPKEVTRSLLDTLTDKDFVNAKSSRVHKFTEEAYKPRDISAESTKELLEELLNRENIKENFETLASWYLQTNYAQSGLLIFSHFFLNGEPQLAIIKAPFVEEAYEPDDEKVLSEMDQVIKKDLKKGILYPRITPSGGIRDDEACIYQGRSGSRYPKHWYQYLHLEPSRTSEEALADQYEETDEDENPLTNVDSTDEFEHILQDVREDAREAMVTVEINNVDVKTKLSELLTKDGVHLVESESGHHLVLSGEKPTVKFYDTNKKEYREILTEIDSFDSFDELE